jgi:hypothetical protein
MENMIEEDSHQPQLFLDKCPDAQTGDAPKNGDIGGSEPM